MTRLDVSERAFEPDGRTPEEVALDGDLNELEPRTESATTKAWLISGRDLLNLPDPGPTPWLVENLAVEQAITACVGRWKTTKSYAILDIAVSVVSGEPAFGALAIPEPGPVVYICEESGKAALQRRLDALTRGRAIDRDRLDGLYLAANQRIKLDDEGWQRELVNQGRELRPRAFIFDPLARMKAGDREENAQKDMGPIVEFLRELRDDTGAAVWFVQHTGHTGSHMRGSSDLETVWESRLSWERKEQEPNVDIKTEHREAEAGAPIRYRISWDTETRTMRFPLVEGPVKAKVRAHLEEHPEASANEVYEALGGNRQAVLRTVKEIHAEGGSESRNHPGTTPSGTGERSGSTSTPFRGAGTTSAQPSREAVPKRVTGLPPSEQSVLDDLHALGAREVEL